MSAGPRTSSWIPTGAVPSCSWSCVARALALANSICFASRCSSSVTRASWALSCASVSAEAVDESWRRRGDAISSLSSVARRLPSRTAESWGEAAWSVCGAAPFSSSGDSDMGGWERVNRPPAPRCLELVDIASAAFRCRSTDHHPQGSERFECQGLAT